MSRHHASTREKLAITAAIAITGTASRGPKAITSTGISMIDEPKPMMPPTVPATSPTTRMSAYSMRAPCVRSGGGPARDAVRPGP